MASPFSIFRKHQKTLMVVLVIGSMIAFTGDSLFNAQGPNLPLLGALLGTALATFAGFQFQRPIPYAIGGAIIGGLIGFFGPSLAGQKGLASDVGTFTPQRISDLNQNRNLANRFIRDCQQRAGLGMGFDVFGFPVGGVERDLMLGEVLLAEADEMGLQVSDTQIFQFIDEMTDGKLPPKEFTAARRNTQLNGRILSEDEMLDVLRSQLRARWAFQALIPFNTDGLPQEVYWDLYRRMNVRQQLASASVSVDNFLSEVGDPSETEIQTFFDQYQNQEPGVEPGMPGFLQPRRIKLAYLEADSQAVLDGLEEVTDDEIQTFYDEKKDDRYKKEVLPEDPTDDDDTFLMDLDKEDGEETPQAPETGDADKAPGDPIESGEKKLEPVKTGEPVESSDPPEKKEEGDGGCDPWQEEGAEEPGTQAPTTTAQDSEEGKNPLPELKLPEGGEVPEDLFKAAPVEYRPLDAALKNEIREEIKREKAKVIVQKRMEDAVSAMRSMEDERDDVALSARDPKAPEVQEKLRQLDPELCRRLKAYAAENDLLYVETPLVSFYEFSNAEEYPIAAASDPEARYTMLMRSLFGAQGANTLFSPKTVRGANEYVYWVLADYPVHVPRLEEPGVREQVIEAWKREKARPLAEKRAEQLAEKVRAGLDEARTMSESLKGETETGEADSPTIVVSDTENSFSWVTSSSAPQLGMRQPEPEITSIQNVPNVGNPFMNYIFRSLKEGEVGVRPDASLMNYYVVQPLNRFPAEEADWDAYRERFIKAQHSAGSATGSLATRQIIGPANNEWLKQLEAKYDVKLLTQQ